ncbi:MAG: 16S rRNA (guanine(966)-N(2))-methyltransferase RsmD [Candidatus Hydrogenedentes bacterium]|nr:16S rRNA (guanine(966)-N(2))-methyltransferase RsmD [Candidatus Hydrogenedentota bacterium]
MPRVIAGLAKGIRLDAPEGATVRPTLDRVRESLFSILMPRLPGARFADLFAGSGANGIEALSRGAAAAVFVDSDARSLDSVQQNLARAKLSATATQYQLRLPSGLTRLRKTEAPFDLVYADPPFDFTSYDALLETLVSDELLRPQGLVIIEHASTVAMPGSVRSLTRQRQVTYGTVTLTFFA